MSIFTWSNTALSNANADTDINFAEGQDPGTVNDSARQMMRKVATFRDMVGGALVTAGTAGAYTLTFNHAPVAYSQGFYVCFEAHLNNTAAPTMNVNAIGTAELVANDGSALAADDLVAGSYYMATYDATAGKFYVLNMPGAFQSLSVGDLTVTGTSTLGVTNVTGAFTSLGIDDDASKIVVTVSDTGIALGDGTAAEAYRIDMLTVSDGHIEIGAGPAANLGFNIVAYGSTHATLANDLVLAAGLTTVMDWDNSLGLWTMTGDVTITGDLVISTDFTLTGQSLSTIDLGANRVIDVGAATALTDAPQVTQVQDNDFIAADDSGAVNAYVITLAPAITAYAKYQEFWFTTSTTNTAASTININGLGVKNIKRNSTDALSAGDIRTDRPNHIIYDGTQFILQGAGLVEPGARHHWLVAGAGILGTVTSGATYAKGEFGTINLTVPVLNFANAAIQVADAIWTPPKSYDGGTIRVKLYWGSGSAGGATNVEWDVAAAFLGDDDAIGGAVSTPVTITSGAPATAEDIEIAGWTAAITPNGTRTDDGTIAIRVRRLGNDANDTFTGTAGLIGIVVEYTVDAGTDA